ncbi:unnamed protein product [Mytilus coruscus]|uniref:Uncharacterized protein n=1 Tax=Mytilus coruscus TaxID=42192 RepID=A0A6J8F5D9_MYTCO|nr:unnamed protein product [Mytilus coruscus]
MEYHENVCTKFNMEYHDTLCAMFNLEYRDTVCTMLNMEYHKTVCTMFNMEYHETETCLKEEICVKCQNSISQEDAVVELGEKGSHSVYKASKSHQDNVVTSVVQKLYQNCRKSYTKPKYIALANREIKHETTNVPKLRSKDLHAPDALYHQTCSVNFRTLKQTPLVFHPPAKKTKTQARRKSTLSWVFLLTANNLHQNEDEQIRVTDLVKKMSENCGVDDAYGVQHRKNKLKEYFGDKIIISEINQKQNVVTVRSILHEFYEQTNTNRFCSSYTEIQKFECCAAAEKGNDIPNFVAGSFLQHVADDVDHNSGTLDGNNTFHGMGIMAEVTLGSFGTKPIPRIDVTSEQIALLAKINFSYYIPSESNRMASCVYSNLRRMNYKDVMAFAFSYAGLVKIYANSSGRNIFW